MGWGKNYRDQIPLPPIAAPTPPVPDGTEGQAWMQRLEAVLADSHTRLVPEASEHTVGELLDRYQREVLPHKAPTM